MPLSEGDLLAWLPRKPLETFAKGQSIGGAPQTAGRLYLVILGRVKVTCAADGGTVISRIVGSEGLFGESCLIGKAAAAEEAVALDPVTVMSWTRDEIEQQIALEPRLGIALIECLSRQCLEFKDRIEGVAIYKTPVRVMLALRQLAHDLGTPLVDGSVRMPALTHHTLAEYVGTSREIVTSQLNRLRGLGLIRYSRQYIEISVPAVEAALREQDVRLPESAAAPQKPARG